MSPIGTQLPSADAASCPHLADADIGVLNEESGFDPTETLFDPSLKRDIVPFIACTQPPAGGVAWHSTSDGENSYSHWSAQQLRGRSRRARSNWRCRWSAFSRALRPRQMRSVYAPFAKACVRRAM